MQYLWLFLGGLLLAGGSAIGQTGGTAPNSLSPGVTPSVPQTQKKSKLKDSFFSPSRGKETKYRKPNVRHTARYEFYERIEKAAREKQRILRKLSKPQFSNPAYFGHKKMPKRRPPHKMRHCGECQIRH